MNYRILFSLVATLFIFLSCEKRYTGKPIPIVAHAGSGIYNPKRLHAENSANAIYYALSFPDLAGVELDVQLSKDGTLWLFHDEDLAPNTTGEGKLCDYTDEELSTIRYRNFNKEPLARLDEIDFSLTSSLKEIFIELKLFNTCISDSLYRSYIIQGFKAIQAQNNSYVNFNFCVNSSAFGSFLLENNIFPLYADANDLNQAKFFIDSGFKGVFLRNRATEEDLVKAIQSYGGKVILFDVRTLFSIRRAMKKNPDFLMVEDFKTALLEK